MIDFAGLICKKYVFDMRGILQYVCNKLKTQESGDLLVFQEIIKNMSNMETLEDMTEVHLEAQKGGAILTEENSYSAKATKTQKRAIGRLRKTLLEKTEDGEDLAVPLVILTGQQLNSIVYKKEHEDAHVKLVSTLYDQCHETLQQFTSFIERHVVIQDFATRVPDVSQLCSQYHLEPVAAFHIARQKYKYQVKEIRDKQEDPTSSAAYVAAATEAMGPIVESCKTLYPDTVWSSITPRLYAVFWTLSIQDLVTPKDLYKSTISKLKDSEKVLDDDPALRKSKSKMKKERERIGTLIDNLAQEEKLQYKTNRAVRARLEDDKDQWTTKTQRKGDLVKQFFEKCIVPRCLFSMVDAVFCAKFAAQLHSLKTENWGTLLYYDKLLTDVTCIVTCCTEAEAKTYGRFLNETLTTLWEWHGSEAVFNEKCLNYPGFHQKDDKYHGYEDFRDVCHKWNVLLTKSFRVMLRSGDYTMTRNCILVMHAILPNFPRIDAHGVHLSKEIEKMLAIEEKPTGRKDLHLKAKMFQTFFARQTGQNKQFCNLVREEDFHIKRTKDKKGPPAKQKGASNPSANDDDMSGGGDASSRSSKAPESKSSGKGSKADKGGKVDKGKGKDDQKDERESKSSDRGETPLSAKELRAIERKERKEKEARKAKLLGDESRENSPVRKSSSKGSKASDEKPRKASKAENELRGKTQRSASLVSLNAGDGKSSKRIKVDVSHHSERLCAATDYLTLARMVAPRI